MFPDILFEYRDFFVSLPSGSESVNPAKFSEAEQRLSTIKT